MTQLWILRPLNDEDGPWNPRYDRAFGFVVRAETQEDARQFAQERSGDEGAACWGDRTLTTCEPLNEHGDTGVILRDFWSA